VDPAKSGTGAGRPVPGRPGWAATRRPGTRRRVQTHRPRPRPAPRREGGAWCAGGVSAEPVGGGVGGAAPLRGPVAGRPAPPQARAVSAGCSAGQSFRIRRCSGAF